MTNYDLFGRVSTGDTGQRSHNDWYESPRWATVSLLHHHQRYIAGTRVLEPCSGRDAIASVLREAGCEVLTNDIDPGQPSVFHEDAADPAFWVRLKALHVEFDWVITNAAFDISFPVLCHAWQHARIGVAMLLRKTFLEPTEERGAWLQEHPPCRIIGLPRHSFRGTGSDSASCDWNVWHTDTNPFRRPWPPVVVDAGAKTRRAWR